MTKDKLSTYAFWFLAACFLAGGIVALNEISLYTPDSTRYLVWAKSLASFSGYRDASGPEPASYVVHAPLYALLLTPVALFFPGSIAAAKLLTLGIGVLLLYLSFQWYSRTSGKGYALLGSLMLALNPLVFLYSTEVLSDIPFAAALVLTWILTEKIMSEERFRPGTAGALACAVAMALLLREIGVSVLLSTVIFLAYRKRYKEALAVFLIPALLYGAWYVRNELIVAPAENPPLTNAKIFSHHFLTSADASLLQEFAARASGNAGVYAKQVTDLVFSPLFFSMQYDVIASQNPLMAGLLSLMGYVRYPIALFAVLSTLHGLRIDFGRSRAAWLRVLFLAAYVAVVFTYPINDIRFLLPLLILSVYYCLLAWQSLPPGAGRFTPRGAVALLAVALLLPNLLWNILYARTSAAFTSAPVAFVSQSAAGAQVPTHFTKPFRAAGEWIASHSESGSVILTQWKDLAIWSGGRKVLNVDQTLSVDEFEQQIRDYRVRLLVSQLKRSGMTEFAIPMHQSEMYAFRLRTRVGDTEIYEVAARTGEEPVDDTTSFGRGIEFMKRGEYRSADSLLSVIWGRSQLSTGALFLLASAKGLQGEVSAADSLFAILRAFPQSGIYIRRASQLQQVLHADVRSRALPAGPRQAEGLTGASAGYWNAGWRKHARLLIEEALRQDSSCGPAMVFGFHFALKQDDLLSGKNMADQLATRLPQHPVAPVLFSILSHRDSLASASNPAARAAQFAKLAEAYKGLGLSEDAITYGLEGLADAPDDEDLTVLVADLYLSKRRYAPAFSLLSSFLGRHPESAAARERFSSVSDRF